jgi:ATP-dependent protease ClpP protease subunit
MRKTKRNLKALAGDFSTPKGLSFELAPLALERWAPDLKAAATAAPESISILEPIGYDPWTGGGVTVKRIDAALRAIGAENDVVINVNSPGGDLFEGIAIYNRIREHKGFVQVKVLGIAASAASVIAMAADELLMPRAGFLMIHDTWVVALGNRNDLRDVADTLEPFDQAMADIYAERSGIDQKKVMKMMDAETWINGSAAVDQGFADGLLPADEVTKDETAKQDRVAAYLLDMALAKAGMPRSSRRQLMQEYKSSTRDAVAPSGTPRATEATTGTPCAADEVLTLLESFKL